MLFMTTMNEYRNATFMQSKFTNSAYVMFKEYSENKFKSAQINHSQEIGVALHNV